MRIQWPALPLDRKKFSIMYTYILSILSGILRMAITDDHVSLADVDELVDLFRDYREHPGCLQFCAAMGDPDQRVFRSVARSENYLNTYLHGDTSKLFDTARKIYKICNREGFEKQKKMIKDAMEFAYNDLATLAQCLPHTPDFEESEMGLVNILNSIGYYRKSSLFNKDVNQAGEGLVMSCFLDEGRTRFDRPFHNKKYMWGMLRFELLNTTTKERDKLIQTVGPLLSLQNLIELSSFARKHKLGECIFDIEGLIYQKKKDSNNTTTSEITCIKKDHKADYILGELFKYDGIREEILERLDWRTLWYTMPYVSKLFSLNVSRKFVIQRCRDLKEYLKKEAKICSPDYLYYVKHPWNSLFPSVHHLVKFYMDSLNRNKSAIARQFWKDKVIDGMSLFKYDDELVNECMLSYGCSNMKSDLPFECLVRATNAFLAKKPELYCKRFFADIDFPILVKLISKVDQPVELYQFVSENIVHTPIYQFLGEYIIYSQMSTEFTVRSFLTAILAADQLDWPEEVKEMAQADISHYCGVDIELPLTVARIRELAPVQLHQLVQSLRIFYCSTALEVKIFYALSDRPSIILVFTSEDFIDILKLFIAHPFSFSEQQFVTFLRRVIELKGDDREFQDSLSTIISDLRYRVEN